jgi:hypothetical protein
MASDNQFTALWPAIVGFQTDSASIDRGAEITGNQVGVKGFCGGPVGDGVQGFGRGNFSRVAGFAGGDDNSANSRKIISTLSPALIPMVTSFTKKCFSIRLIASSSKPLTRTHNTCLRRMGGTYCVRLYSRFAR